MLSAIGYPSFTQPSHLPFEAEAQLVDEVVVVRAERGEIVRLVRSPLAYGLDMMNLQITIIGASFAHGVYVSASPLIPGEDLMLLHSGEGFSPGR
jgi:hypothetical protein